MSDTGKILNFVNIDKLRSENDQTNWITISCFEKKNNDFSFLDEMVIIYEDTADITYTLIAFFTKYLIDNYDFDTNLISAAYSQNTKVAPTISKRGESVYGSYFDFHIEEFKKITFFIKVYFSGIAAGDEVEKELINVDNVLME